MRLATIVLMGVVSQRWTFAKCFILLGYLKRVWMVTSRYVSLICVLLMVLDIFGWGAIRSGAAYCLRHVSLICVRYVSGNT